MARKVFISILGVSYYQETNYYFNNENNSVKTRFVQEAALKLIAKEFKQEDVAYIFLTEKAKNQNWESPPQTEHFQVKNKEKETYTGLKETLQNCNFQFQIKNEDIANGDDEKEIWQIFQSVFDVLEPEDEVYFDITHAFRSIPMLVMVLINYAKFLKKITVKSITYGNWEARKSDFSPIIDITSFSTLQDWTSGADIFVNFGNAKRIKEISSEKIAEKIQDIMRLFSTVRGGEIVNGLAFDKLKNEIEKFKKALSEKSIEVPLIPLIDYMEKTIADYKGNNVMNGISAIRFCIDNDLIQQAYTLMQEMIISYLLDLENEKYTDKISRIVLSACFQTNKENYKTRLNEFEQKEIKKVELEKRLVEKLYKSQYISYFADIYSKLTPYRNDFNHAGTKGDARPAEKFYNEADSFYNEIMIIIKKTNNKI